MPGRPLPAICSRAVLWVGHACNGHVVPIHPCFCMINKRKKFLPHVGVLGGCRALPLLALEGARTLQGLASACPNLAARVLCACGPRAAGLPSTYLRLEDPFSTRCKSCIKPKVSLQIGCPSIIKDDRSEPETPIFTPYIRQL